MATDEFNPERLLGEQQRKCLVKRGAGPATYYQLADWQALPLFAKPGANTSELGTNTSELPPLLRERIAELSPKARKDKLWPVILWLCATRPYKAEELANLLNRKITPLKTSHLSKLRDQQGLLDYLHPEVVNHPEQAYRTTAAGISWLQLQGITL